MIRKMTKNKLIIFLSLFFTLSRLSSTDTFAQLHLPQPSPKSTLKQTVGLTEFTLEYSRPSAKGRVIFGELVPYGKVWRTGANKATFFETTDDITVEGNFLPKGQYSIFSIPNEDHWIIIFHKNTELWGPDEYTEELDALKFSIPVLPIEGEYTETFTIDFADLTENSVEVIFSWERVKVQFMITVEVTNKAMMAIKDAIAKAASDDWQTYARASNYLSDKNEPVLALQYAERAVSIKPTFYTYRTLAKALGKNGRWKEALNAATTSDQLGTKEGGDYAFYKESVLQMIAEFKTKVPVEPTKPAKKKK
jgi:hypothetical protein